jgi:hypothetical protein
MTEHRSAPAGPAGDRREDDVPVIDREELRRMLEQRTPVQLLDVRPADERAEWFIPESLHRGIVVAAIYREAVAERMSP